MGCRIDKYLWAVRLFRTRSLAAEACRKGSVRIAGKAAKPSRVVRPGLHFQLRVKGMVWDYRVKEVLEKRVGAKLVEEYLEDLTPPEVRLEAAKQRQKRPEERGRGRPTKKDRREMENIYDAGD